VNLGFEWKIQGDDDRNAMVAVEYRKKGEARWRAAQPLLRMGDEKVWRAKEHMEYTTPRMFAGSILDLEEGATYECRFTMRVPGGVRGNAVQTATVRRARCEGYAAAHADVYPPGYKGTRQEPSL
jgi:hypothetical protein